MTRHSIIGRGVLAVAISIGLALVSANTEAAAPQVKQQAPGYYRMMLGDFEITALTDGIFDMPADQVLHQAAAKTDASLEASFLGSPTETSVNAFVVNTGDRLILIDTGSGAFFGPELGKISANLVAAGYRPEQVDDVLITHIHPDHVGGLSADGKALFPNAIVHADKADTDFWLSPKTDGKTDMMKYFIKSAQTSLAPYVDKARLSAFEGEVEIAPGVKSWATHGHTPGHTSYIIESKGQKLVVIGDLIHVAAVQLADPTVTIDYDNDSAVAAQQRTAVFGQLAKDGSWVAAAHLSFPGIGHLRSIGSGFQWMPVNYTTKLK